VYNTHNWVVIVMPLTSRDTAAYDQVLIQPPEGGLTNPSVTLPDQLRAVDRNRLVGRLGILTPATLKKVEDSLRIVLEL
jgi:mRNA interferase MazF